jgi:uncharacterized membrane protein
MQAGGRLEVDAGRALERVTAFSDGVFAIAITLLVLNLDVPRLTGAEQDRLGHELLTQGANYYAFALSFAVIARFWVVHHRLFLSMTRLDDRGLAGNFVFLAAVVLIPFASEVLGRYGEEPAAVVTYALVVGAAIASAVLLGRHAARRGLLREPEEPRARRLGERAAVLRVALFALSIPVAFISTGVAEALWVVALLARPVRR